MELIQRTISLEPYIDRRYKSPTWGQITADTFYVNVLLTQNLEDMGIMTEMDFIPKVAGQVQLPDYTLLIDKLNSENLSFPFMNGVVPSNSPEPLTYDTRVTGKTVQNYYYYGNYTVTGTTESRLGDLQSYNQNQTYILNFDIATDNYLNFNYSLINGVTRITSLSNPIVYVFDADKNDNAIGTAAQMNGLVMSDFTGNPTVTTFSYHGEGYNMTNTSLSALTKEEYLFGVISKPEVQSDVFIDRTITVIYEKHLKLAEITNLDELVKYGQGYYNITKI